jgi:hypothetical protein
LSYRSPPTFPPETRPHPLLRHISSSLSLSLRDLAWCCPECKKKDFADYGWILRALICRFMHEV